MDALYRFSCLCVAARNHRCVIYVNSWEGGQKVPRGHGGAFLPGGKVAPFFTGSLFLNERLEVELRVKLVRLCAGVRKDPLLIEVFGDLNIRTR